MKLIGLSFFLSILSLFSSAATAGYLVSNNPVEGTYQLVDSSGWSLTLDARQQLTIFESATGVRTTATFAQMAAYHDPDPVKQAAFLNKLRAAILDPTNEIAITSATEPTLNLKERNGSGEGSYKPYSHGKGGKESSDLEVSGFGGFDQACGAFEANCDCIAGVSCTPYIGYGAQYFYAHDRHSPSSRKSREQQICEALHRDMWNQMNGAACESMSAGAAGTAFAAIGAAISCVGAAVSAGLAIPACAATLGAAAIGGTAAYRSYQSCTAKYPGPPDYCDD